MFRYCFGSQSTTHRRFFRIKGGFPCPQIESSVEELAELRGAHRTLQLLGDKVSAKKQIIMG
jgi:hypothetical protein